MNIQVTRCLWCGELLLNHEQSRQPRSDKKFCNARHRSAYNRWFKNINKYEAEISLLIGKLADYLQHPLAQQSSVESMVRLREKINAEMSWAGVKAVR